MSKLLRKGDIYMTDSDDTGPKIVKFLMTAPTLWHYLWRCLPWNKQNEVRFYHIGIIEDDTWLIEQQWKVQRKDSVKNILERKHVIWSKTSLNEEDRGLIVARAKNDLKEGYDILLILGKTATFLTGIKFFSRHVHLPQSEICPTRVAYWYKPFESFGLKVWNEATTDLIDDFCVDSSDWVCVSSKT